MTDGSRNSSDLENYNGVAVYTRAADGTSLPVGPDGARVYWDGCQWHV